MKKSELKQIIKEHKLHREQEFQDKIESSCRRLNLVNILTTKEGSK